MALDLEEKNNLELKTSDPVNGFLNLTVGQCLKIFDYGMISTAATNNQHNQIHTACVIG